MEMLEKYKDFLRSTDTGLLVLRLNVGGLLAFHGVHKAIYGLGNIVGMLAGVGLPSFIAYGSLLCELVASLMVVFGVWTRAAAAAIAANMVVAVFLGNMPMLFTVNPNTGGWGIELPMLYLLPALALCFTGGGKYTLTRGTIFD